MLKLYYSGGRQEGQYQDNPDLSLGGFVSIVGVPNDTFDALFGLVSEKGIAQQLIETKAVFVKNESDSALANISIACRVPENAACKLEFAPVSVVNQKSIEMIESMRNSPFYADFFEIAPNESELIMETLPAGQLFAIWIRRTILPRPPMPDIENEQEFQQWAELMNEKVEEIEIELSWD